MDVAAFPMINTKHTQEGKRGVEGSYGEGVDSPISPDFLPPTCHCFLPCVSLILPCSPPAPLSPDSPPVSLYRQYPTKTEREKICNRAFLFQFWGGPQASAHTSLGFFFFACSKPICLALGSHKTNLVFTPNSIYHIFSDLLDHQHQPSHL